MRKVFGLLIVVLFPFYSVYGQEQEIVEDFFHRDSLLGDWAGIRPYLDEQGLTYELLYTAELFRNMRGGLKSGGDYRGDVSLFMELDTETTG